MEYQIIEKDYYFLIKIAGILTRDAIESVGQILRPFIDRPYKLFALDMGSVPADRELIYQVGLLNALRKEIELARCRLKVCYLNPTVKEYLLKNRLDIFFDLYNDINEIEHSVRDEARIF